MKAKDGLRLKINIGKKLFANLCQKYGFIKLVSEEEFLTKVNNSKYNKGEVLEQLVNSYYGKEWHKDNIQYNIKGDIEIAEKQVQIKYGIDGNLSSLKNIYNNYKLKQEI